jgi:hypothetical protein
MKRALKSASFALLALILLQAGGLWMSIKTTQVLHVAQQEIRAKSNPASTKHFTISKAVFEAGAIDGENELMLDGKMFDVIALRDKVDSVQVSAFEDCFETRLIALLLQTSQSKDKNIQGEAFLFALMHLNFIAPTTKEFELNQIIYAASVPVAFVHPIWQSGSIGVAKQPPEYEGEVRILV